MKIAEILMQNQAKIAEIAQKYKIKLVYLFGSHARDQATPMSDIDLAVLLEDEIPQTEYLNIQFGFAGEIEKALKLENVDVRILNHYSPRFRFSVYSEGKILYSKDEDTRIDFQLRTFHEYNDIKHIYDLSDHYLFQRLINRDYS